MVLPLLILLAAFATTKGEDAPDVAFEAFIAEYGRPYRRGETDYEQRRAIFELRRAAVAAQNSRHDSLWTAGLNDFADRTEEERARVLGWRGKGLRHQARVAEAAALIEISENLGNSPLETIDWRNLTAAGHVQNQGSCGSCWAFATEAVLSAHYEIYRGGKPRGFSVQELVSCVPNPNACGGTGGCDGATVELGLDWATKQGLSDAEAVPYLAANAACEQSTLQVESDGDGDVDSAHRGEAFGLVGFQTLPMNKEEPLVQALVEKGPVAVAIMADGLYDYSSGIFNACSRDGVVNHAVTAFGFGKQGEHRYWLIRNSWGTNWGEGGFFRLMRLANEEQHCGTDDKPQEGVGCAGGPSQVTVCGSCGILYDTTVPRFERATAAVLARHNGGRHRRGRKASGAMSAAITSDATASFMRRESP